MIESPKEIKISTIIKLPGKDNQRAICKYNSDRGQDLESLKAPSQAEIDAIVRQIHEANPVPMSRGKKSHGRSGKRYGKG